MSNRCLQKAQKAKTLGTENNSCENIFKGHRKARALRIGHKLKMSI